MLAPRNLVLFLAIVLPWFLALVSTHPEFLRYGLVEESARRFLTRSFRRTEPVYYFGPVLLLVFYPWSALLPEAALIAWRNRGRWMRADRFLILWAVVVVVFFSLSQSKRPGYILPAIVAFAALTARLFDHALAESEGRAIRLVLRGTMWIALLSTSAAAALSLNLGRPDRLQALLGFESNEFGRLQPDLGVLVVSVLVVASWRSPSGCAAMPGLRWRCSRSLPSCSYRSVLERRRGMRRPARRAHWRGPSRRCPRHDRRVPGVLRRWAALLRRRARDLYHGARSRRADQQLRPVPAEAGRDVARYAGTPERSRAMAVPPDGIRVRADEKVRAALAGGDRPASRRPCCRGARGWWGALVPPPA